MELLHYAAYSLFLCAFFICNMMEQLSDQNEEVKNIGVIFMVVSTMVSEVILVYIFNIMNAVSQDT